MKSLNEQDFATLRRRMVEVIEFEFDLVSDETERTGLGAGLREALLAVPRHQFVPSPLAPLAYQDRPLPIGFDKTISQPFIGALMVELLDLDENSRVLEVGTGLGYLTAILGSLAAEVYSVEIVEEFVDAAQARVRELGYGNVAVRVGDGSRGWEDAAPFDAIVVSAAATEIPPALARQLAEGGRLVLPLEVAGSQRLVRAVRVNGHLLIQEVLPVAFTRLETLFRPEPT